MCEIQHTSTSFLFQNDYQLQYIEIHCNHSDFNDYKWWYETDCQLTNDNVWLGGVALYN